ncbi:WD repeat-containing protein 38-like isoform X2 [Neoarius graeffei]|uniref:WD repeat-containing protein 38-like isoform X2 n=1 Tax=Neoarius graeffei TaxID=443677 RepID=UPI00298C919C|nr:WD repeat-containing protein 38-like isoform X2 [Neoarius graeffei]
MWKVNTRKFKIKMTSELSNSRPAPPVVEDEDLQGTKVKDHGSGLFSMSNFDADSMDTEGEDESEADPDSETVQDISLSIQDPSPVSANRETSFPQTPPKTDGDFHIHTVLDCGSEVMVCQFSNDGTLLAVGLTDGSIKVYSTDGGELLHTLRDQDSIVSSLPVTSLCFTHTSQEHSILLATYASGCMRCWYVSGRQCMWWLKETRHNGENEEGMQRQALCLSISPSGKQAVTGGSDAAICLYDLNTHQRIQNHTASSMRTVMDGHSSRIFAVTFHPARETEFISGGWDNTIQFWDTRQHHAVRMLYGPHVCGEALHINPSTNQILSGSWRKHTTLEVKSRLSDLPSAVFSSSICPSERWPGLIAATSGSQVFLVVMDQ